MLEKPSNVVSSRHYIEMAERFAGVGFWNADMATGAIRATPGFFKVMGLAADGAFSLGNWISLVHPQDQEDFRSIFPIARTGMPVSREVRLTQGDHAFRWIRVGIDPVTQNGGPQDLVVGLVEDMTGEQRARIAVARERARLEALVGMIGEVFWVADVSGSILDLKGWEAVTGQGEDEICGGGWAEAVHAEDRPRVVEEWASCIRSAAPYAVSCRLRYRDGEHRRVTLRGMPVRSDGGKPVEWLGTIHEAWRLDGLDMSGGGAVPQPQQLRAARAMLGWSAEELAQAAGISSATIRRYETGEASLKETTLHAITAALLREGIVLMSSREAIGVRLSRSDPSAAGGAG